MVQSHPIPSLETTGSQREKPNVKRQLHDAPDDARALGQLGKTRLLADQTVAKMLTIISANGLWRATLEEIPDDGILLELFALKAGLTPKFVCREVICDVVFHVLLDRVHARLKTLNAMPGVHTMPVRRR